MTPVTTLQPYEILIRFNDDGTIGAHKQNISITRMNGEIVGSFPMSPESINLDELTQLVGDMSEEAWYIPPPLDL